MTFVAQAFLPVLFPCMQKKRTARKSCATLLGGGGLRPCEHAAAELEEFGYEGGAVFTSGVGGVDFGGEEDGSGDIGAAFKTIFFFVAGKIEQFRLTAAGGALRSRERRGGSFGTE